MEKNFCPDHSKHVEQIKELENKANDNTERHRDIWKALESRISTKWLFALIPLFVSCLIFQATIYNGVKDIQKDVAVMQEKMKPKVES